MKLDDQIIDSVPASIYWKDLDGKYLGCNAYMLRMVGLNSRAEIIGKTDYDLCWKDHADEVSAYDQEVIATGKTIDREESGILANGEIRTYLSSKTPLYNEKRNIIGIIGNSTDITESKNLRTTLNENEKLLNNQILDAMPASIYWKDKNGKYLGCNNYMVAMAGVKSKNEIIGKTDFNLPWKIHANIIKEYDEKVLNSNQTIDHEEKATLGNGSVRNYISSKSPLYKDDKTVGLIGISIDITELKKLQETFSETEKNLSDSLKVKERFLRNISHEVRNPMQAFVSIAETIVEKWDRFNEKQRFEMCEMVLDSGKRLSTLVSNTFELSNLIGNKVQLELKKHNLTETIKSVMLEFNYVNKTFKETVRLLTDKDYFLVFDRRKIEKIIGNLLMNSLKWNSKGKLVTIELHESFINNSSVPAIQCCIKDQGIGIPEQELNLIFQPFTESSKTATQTGGIGLGLAISKEIITAHAGEIWAENNLTSGATFNFLIPCTLVPNVE